MVWGKLGGEGGCHGDLTVLSIFFFLSQDDDLEEGEVKDPNDRKVRPRPTCRFFMKGNNILQPWE